MSTVTTDKTSEIQALINGALNGNAIVDMTPYDGMGATTIGHGPTTKSLRLESSRPIVFRSLPMKKKTSSGAIVTINKGLIHIDHSLTKPESVLPYFYSSPNITFDGGGTTIKDPVLSDAYHNPLGLLRPIFSQVGYKEGRIERFEWHSNTRNTTKSALSFIETTDGLIEGCNLDNANRHAIGVTYKQGTSPFKLTIRNVTCDNVSAPFDLSVPEKDLVRDVTPNCIIENLRAKNVWWRTKIHGCWNADVQMNMSGDGRVQYAGFDIANDSIGTVRLHNSRFENYPNQCVGWNHSGGQLIIEACQFIDSYTPIMPSNVQPLPVIMRGPMVYDDCAAFARLLVGDLIYQTKTAGMTATQIDDQWLVRMRAAMDSYKAENIPPQFWGGMLFYKPCKAYVSSIGWTGSAWL